MRMIERLINGLICQAQAQASNCRFYSTPNQNTAVESRYYGPYDRLFAYAVIEGSFTFFLARQTAPDETFPRDAVLDFVIFMTVVVVVDQEQGPVLIVDIKDD